MFRTSSPIYVQFLLQDWTHCLPIHFLIHHMSITADRGHGKQVYKGEFSEGLRHGTGTLTVPFALKRGKGTAEDDWAVYEGEWNKGQRHGKGKWCQPDGAEYEGEYKFDKMWGVGTWRSRDGDVYEGRYKDNIR